MKKKEKINVFENTTELSKGFTEFLAKLLEVYPHVNIALSGGSTPKVIFDYWAEHGQKALPWDKISFYWGDERCVTPEDDMSNFGMTRNHLFDKLKEIKGKNIFRIHGENEASEEAKRYGEVLESKLMQIKDTPSFELIMLGLGDDGHTVSIFPHEMDLWYSKQNCVVASHPETGMNRVSISGKVVNSGQHIIFFATGKNKAEKVRDVIKNRKQFEDKYPAAKVKPRKGYLYWFLDKEAASLLD